MAATYSSLFLSHGAPTLPISGEPARDFLAGLGVALGKPKAIVAVSPHWMTRTRAVKSPARYSTWHDFGGFPDELYSLRYEAPGSAELKAEVLHRLGESYVESVPSEDRKLDHGVWVPLLLMYPQADVPIVQVSATLEGPQAYFKVGRALASLAQEGVLLIGSGGFVHNLHEVMLGGFDNEQVPDWAQEFHDWCDPRVKAGQWDELLDYRRRAPNAERAHPTDEHFMPLFFAAGAGGAATALHGGFAHGSLGMAAYGFA